MCIVDYAVKSCVCVYVALWFCVKMAKYIDKIFHHPIASSLCFSGHFAAVVLVLVFHKICIPQYHFCLSR